ncbi:MAG: protease modulator HflK N-terminal domain-containing protein, partial [Hyphomonadaceae bacterium]|nr:protease modulator HflK N-terminal domain-containing protein [Hyphomonadaceae bacterium]
MSDNKSPWGGRSGGKKPQNSSGNKSPWGTRGRPDRAKPKAEETSPDLENVIQDFKTRLGDRGPRGGGGGEGPQLPFGKFGPFGTFLLVGAAV